jgi:glutamate-5-semialdehyde dehydrogenase
METTNLIIEANKAKTPLASLSTQKINDILTDAAQAIQQQATDILEANQLDLNRMDRSNPKYDRLQLTPQRIADMTNDMVHVAKLPSPLHKVLSEAERPNGMKISKVVVPFGVIGVIYEARPNVTTDVFALCLKSGNVCLLKGGSDAAQTNQKIVEAIHTALQKHNIPTAVCTLLPAHREATVTLLNAVGQVDLIIPRGSSTLINFVRDNARVPVIETGAGICHTYFDAAGNIEKGTAIIENAKTRRVSVCNALDCLLIHESRIADTPKLCEPLATKNVIIYADEKAYAALQPSYPAHLLMPATAEHFGTEFLDYKMSIRTVSTFEEALAHIATHSSRHSECIISEDQATIKAFQITVDAACVYANVSTAFTDGAQFGFGAEIGISTQKLHARGPMALPELTTYKYIIEGDGQTRW